MSHCEHGQGCSVCPPVWYELWEYDEVDWLPCPTCFNVQDYSLEQLEWLDDYGIDFTLELDPDLTDPYYSHGSTVDLEYDDNGEISQRHFHGCQTCGGSGDCVKVVGEDDVIGKSWWQWVVVEGGVTLGTGKVPKQ